MVVRISPFVIPGCASWPRPGIHTPDRGYGFRARSASLRVARPGMTDVVVRSRDTLRPSLCHSMSLLNSEGAGNAGGALHPRSHTQMEKGAHEHTGSAEAPGIPCVMALR